MPKQLYHQSKGCWKVYCFLVEKEFTPILNTASATSAAICYSMDVLSNSIEQRKEVTIIDEELRAISIQVQDYDRQESSWTFHWGIYWLQNGFMDFFSL